MLDRKAADHEFADGLQDLEKDSAKTLAGMLEMVKNVSVACSFGRRYAQAGGSGQRAAGSGQRAAPIRPPL